MYLEPIEDHYGEMGEIESLIWNIWPIRCDNIVKDLYKNIENPGTDRFFLIFSDEAQMIGTTGYYRYDDTSVGLCWHGLIANERKKGISRLAFDMMCKRAIEEYPNASSIVELIPHDRFAFVQPYFKKLGFECTLEAPLEFEWLPKDQVWYVYRKKLGE